MKNTLDAVKHVDVEAVAEDAVEQATNITAGQVLTQCVSSKMMLEMKAPTAQLEKQTQVQAMLLKQ
jgi:hypothetical protein